MTKPRHPTLTRRSLFAGTAAAALTGFTQAHARVPAGKNTDYTYEVSKSDEAWRAQLGDQDFAVLREGFTEKPKSSPYWLETRPGTYHCKGCDLPVYDSRHKVLLDKGWVFFFHSIPAAVLMNIDGPTPDYGAMAAGSDDLVEVHCRRCGSHLGHFLIVEGGMKHCINGASLTFEERSS